MEGLQLLPPASWLNFYSKSLILSHLAETSQLVLPFLIVSTCIFVVIGTAFLINLWTLKW